MKKQEQDTDQISPLVEMQNTFRDATGLRLIAEGAKWIATGVFMGTSDAVPGYAGGTTLSLLGYYKKIILMAKSMVFPEEGITRLRAFMFMLPFGIGWIGGVFGFAKLTEFMMEHNMGLELLFFFSAFVTFAIPIFLIRERPGLVDWEKKKVVKTKKWFLAFIGFSIIISASLAALFLQGGVKFGKDGIKDTVYSLGGLNWLKLAGIAYLAGIITLLPGGSGAIVQLLSNMYDKIHWIIMAHFHENLLGLFIFALFTFLGMFTMVFIMSRLFKKHKKSVAALSFGMMFASIFAVLIVPEPSIWSNLKDVKHLIAIIGSWILGASAGITILIFGIKNQKKKKLRRDIRLKEKN